MIAAAALAGCSVPGGSTPSPTPADAAEDLVVASSRHVADGDDHLAVTGTARNAGSVPLVDCVVRVTVEVDWMTFRRQAHRDRLAPGQSWEWTVTVSDTGKELPAEEASNVTIETRASYEG